MLGADHGVTKALARASITMARRETLELVRACYKITDPKIRKRLFEVTKALGAAASKDS